MCAHDHPRWDHRYAYGPCTLPCSCEVRCNPHPAQASAWYTRVSTTPQEATMAITVRDAAEAAVREGTIPRVYDYALPQQWVDAIHHRTGVWPQTLGMVWGYPETGRGSVWGRPYGLTDEARAFLVQIGEA